jgi:sec-independent protein translocase protein TatA
MQVISQTGVIASIFGGWEIVLILAVVLILFGAKRLPDLARGLGQGLRQFRRETMKLPEELDEGANDAGKSLGRIYGKPAYEALTPDNQTAEIYDPAIMRDRQKPGWGAQNAGFLGWRRFFRRIWYFLSDLLNRKAA